MIDEDIFGLEDKDYWSDPWRTRRSVQRQMMESGADAFVIGAPRLVALSEHSTLPLAILRVCNPKVATSIPTKGIAIVTAVDLNTRELRARLAFDPEPESAAPYLGDGSGKPDTFANDPTAMRSDALTVDLAQRLHIPMLHGEHLLSVIMRERVSNRCRMKLVESTSYEDPEVDKFVSEFQSRQDGPLGITPQPRPAIASYEAHPRSPEIPKEPGVTLAVERVSVLTAAPRCLVFGSYRLPVRSRDRVQMLSVPEQAITPNGAAIVESGGALVRISLLLTGSVDTAPQILSMKVPSRMVTPGENPLADGHFALDLCKLLKFSGRPQTYFVYAFSGEVMAGPCLAAFVNVPADWKEKWEEKHRQDPATTFAGEWVRPT
jgi:hypothetical protein